MYISGWVTMGNQMNFRNFDGEMVNKAVAGLVNRKFTMRFVEEDEEDAV